MKHDLTLEDLLTLDEALAYINDALLRAGEKPLSRPGLRRHIYDDPDRPGSLFQLAPIPVGYREYKRGIPAPGGSSPPGGKPMGILFTRRMLDEYLAARAANKRPDAPRRVTRPTDEEAAQVMGRAQALAFINETLATLGSDYRLSGYNFNIRRARGQIPHRIIGNSAVYVRGDMQGVAEDLARKHASAGESQDRA